MGRVFRLRLALLFFYGSLFGAFYSFYGAVAVVFILLGLSITKEGKNWFLFFVVSGVAILSFGIHSSGLESQLERFEKNTLHIHGTINRFPEYKENTINVYIHATKVCIGDECWEVSENILTKLPVGAGIDFGDRGVFYGELQSPRSFSSFDYPSFLKRFGVFYILHLHSFEIRQKKKGNRLIQGAYEVRKKFQNNISHNVSYPYSLLAEGVLLGVKETFPPIIQNMFRKAGLQHIIVVSGFNVSVIMVIVLLLLRPLGPVVTFCGSSLSILFFIALTGADPPVIRAGIMGIITAYALFRGKEGDGLHALLLAGVVVGIWNPFLLRYDIGFQLSFIAALSIILCTPIFEKILWFLPKTLRIILSVSTVAQLSVFPIVGYYFSEIPIGGFLANIIVEPLVPLLMIMGVSTGVLAFFSETLAQISGIVTEIIALSVFWLGRIFSVFPQVELSSKIYRVLFAGEILGFIYLILRTSSNQICNISSRCKNKGP